MNMNAIERFAHEDGDISVSRFDFADGDDTVRTIAVQHSRVEEPIYIPIELAEAVAEAITHEALRSKK